MRKWVKGTPYTYSLRARLLAFFRANPEEHLSAADVIVKFGCGQKLVYTVASQMRKAGELGPGPMLKLPGVEA